jgi:hypothetical protein
MASILLKSATLAAAGSYLEAKYGPPPNKDGPLGLSTWAGLTPLVFTCLSWWSFTYGFTVVSSARHKAIQQAKKDGEPDVDERYAYPNLYVPGTSKVAKEFNCIQRSHQHIMESFTQAALASLIASVHYPVAAGVNALVYAAGRRAMSNGYASGGGDPSKRYSSPLAMFCWYGILANLMLAGLSSLNMLAGKKLLW